MKKRKTTKTGKCRYTLMLVFLTLSALFLTAGKHERKGWEEMPLQAGKEVVKIGLDHLGRRERPENTEHGTEDGQKATEITDEVIIYDIFDHNLPDCMWMHYEDEEVPFVDEETFELIWKAYKEMDYTVECEKGDSEVYEKYKQKFWQLLQNEIPFLNSETGEEIYLKDWKYLDGRTKLQSIEQYTYLFFDMNGDNLPELCVDMKTAVFAYDADADQVTLWTWTREIGGTRAGYYYPDFYDEICEFFRFDEKGNIESEVLFWAEYADLYHYDINMVMFPYYADSEKRPEVTEKMKQQGIYEESSGQWFFRITDEQYEMLAEPFRNLRRMANRRLWESRYTYEGLFGEYMTE